MARWAGSYVGVVVTEHTYGLPTPVYITLIALLILYPLGFDAKVELTPLDRTLGWFE